MKSLTLSLVALLALVNIAQANAPQADAAQTDATKVANQEEPLAEDSAEPAEPAEQK